MSPLADPATARVGRHPLTPEVYRVVDRHQETADVVTLSLQPSRGSRPAFLAGQFNMLTAFGLGEVPISISSAPGGGGPVEHTVRDVGPVTRALCEMSVGDTVGVRGPFGTSWGIETAGTDGNDVVVVAGGIGLAPLRGAVRHLTAQLAGGGSGRLFVLVGARAPEQIVFADELRSWRQSGVHVEVSVDLAGPSWGGTVGVVTTLIPAAPFAPERALALVCGPEIMMRFVAQALIDHGVHDSRIRISLERNMQCGNGLCGHCQLGPLLLCRDGPVVSYSGLAAELLRERQR